MILGVLLKLQLGKRQCDMAFVVLCLVRSFAQVLEWHANVIGGCSIAEMIPDVSVTAVHFVAKLGIDRFEEFGCHNFYT